MSDGFQRKPVHVYWEEGHPLHGFELLMRRKSVGRTLDEIQQEETSQAARRAAGEGGTAEDFRNFTESNLASLAHQIISWNLRDEGGEPVEVSVSGLLSQDDALITSIGERFADLTTRVSGPLASSSAASQPSEEQELQLPMEPLPDSPPRPSEP
jgi:hypothetical protein